MDSLSRVDTAWLRMDEPANRMVITSLFPLSGRLELEALRPLVAERWCSFERMRCRVVESRRPWRPAAWAPDPRFDLDHHLFEERLPSPGNQAGLEALCGSLASRPLDMAHPPWCMHLVQGGEDGRSALIIRVHHCVGDGTGLLNALARLGDPDFQPGQEPPVAPSNDGRRRAVRSIVAAIAALARLPRDPASRLKGPLGVEKVTAWSEGIPLDRIKAVGRATGTTVNDVLVAVVTGSLRRYLADRGDPVDQGFRAAVPVDLKAGKERRQLGNKFGVVFLELPVDRDSAGERLQGVSERMQALKRGAGADAILAILHAIGALPGVVQRAVVGSLSNKATLVLTNVAGPTQPLCLGPVKVEGAVLWVPQTGRLALGASIFSYRGRVWLGFISDRGRLPDPAELVRGAVAELDELSNRAGG